MLLFNNKEDKTRKEEEEAKKKADDDARKKMILSNLTFTGYKVLNLQTVEKKTNKNLFYTNVTCCVGKLLYY